MDMLGTFKKPLIIMAVAIVMLLIFCVAMPAMNESKSYKTPITEIKAENEKVYLTTDEILPEDFSVTAVHEDGAETPLDSTEIELSRTSVEPVGAKTTVTLTYKEDASVYCDADVSVQRDKIMGFECGYPDVTNVVAVLYSNGELCFEGEGDTLVANEGNYAWKEKSDSILSVSFEKGVQPRVMDEWFSGMELLSYVAQIPASVQSMKDTFAECIGLTSIADWTGCRNLLNIDGCYKSCSSLKYTVPVSSSVIRANEAFSQCPMLQKTPNLSGSSSLVKCQNMFSGCTRLVSVTVPPNAEDITGMFMGCTNLQIMPSVPQSVKIMDSAFADCTAMKSMAEIPSSVDSMKNCFSGCQFLQGTAVIHANPNELSDCFAGACIATKLDLTGTSLILDAFANTNEEYMITVNGRKPNPQITSLESYEEYLQEAERARQEELQKQQEETQNQ